MTNAQCAALIATQLIVARDEAENIFNSHSSEGISPAALHAIHDAWTIVLSAPEEGPDEEEETLEELIEDIKKWQNETFPGSTPLSCAKHLKEEVAELAEFPRGSFEIADCFMLIVAVASKGGYDLTEITRRKLEINKKRTFKYDPELGYAKHVGEDNG